jgi:hypothetical protein
VPLGDSIGRLTRFIGVKIKGSGRNGHATRLGTTVTVDMYATPGAARSEKVRIDPGVIVEVFGEPVGYPPSRPVRRATTG